MAKRLQDGISLSSVSIEHGLFSNAENFTFVSVIRHISTFIENSW